MGTVSFGLALVVAPVLLLFLEPRSVVVIANILIVLLLSVVLIELRSHLQLRQIRGMILGGVIAVPIGVFALKACLLYTSPSPRDGLLSRMPSSA